MPRVASLAIWNALGQPDAGFGLGDFHVGLWTGQRPTEVGR